MKNKEEIKKYIFLLLVAAILFWVVTDYQTVGNFCSNIIGIIFPFILGGCIAFLINIPMRFFERKLSNTKVNRNKKKVKPKNKTMVRITSLVLSILVFVFIVFLIINLIVPQLINIGKLIIENIPYYVSEINRLLKETNLLSEINIDTESLKNEVMEIIPQLLSSSISIITGIVGTISNWVIAIIFAMYILLEKEKLREQTKKLMYAYLKEEKVNKILKLGSITQDTFTRFFTVQCLEASILGILCIIGMLILQIPYAFSIGILVGVTALVPIVGAFIGVIIGAILIAAISPIKVITFVIFVLILQQIEGNVIYPRVVGSSIGLPGIWVLVAVTIGGSLMGIVGMLIGVPIACVIYTILKEDVNKRLKEKQVEE